MPANLDTTCPTCDGERVVAMTSRGISSVGEIVACPDCADTPRSKLTTGDEAYAAGRAAYHAGLPCEAPDYGREDRRARWRCGWKLEQAASGACAEDRSGATARYDALRVLETALSAERLAQIDAIVTGNTPMERWERHTGVMTFAHLQEWAERQLREVMTMRAYRDIRNGGVPKDDELGDYLVGKSGALSMMLANMRQIVERSAESHG